MLPGSQKNGLWPGHNAVFTQGSGAPAPRVRQRKWLTPHGSEKDHFPSTSQNPRGLHGRIGKIVQYWGYCNIRSESQKNTLSSQFASPGCHLGSRSCIKELICLCQSLPIWTKCQRRRENDFYFPPTYPVLLLLLSTCFPSPSNAFFFFTSLILSQCLI